MRKSLKIRLALNNKQETMMFQHCGVARHAWNWGLALCKERRKNKEKLLSAIDLHKLLVKDVKPINQWYYNSSKCAPQEALRNLRKAYNIFFKEFKNGTIKKKKDAYIRKCKKKGRPINEAVLHDIGKPKFKKKGKRDSFYLEGSVKLAGNKIKLPRIGWVRCAELLPDIEIKNVTVSRTANQWFVSFKVPYTPIVTKKRVDLVGVDLGIKTLATLSTGESFENLKPFKKYKRKLKLAQRSVSKKLDKTKKVQSNNYHKAAMRVAKIHQQIANIRKDAMHKLTTYLSKNHAEIVIEDLNVKGMMKNKNLANAIADGAFYEFRRQLEYKTKWYGSKLTVINRFYPSSKTCSTCGNVKQDLKLSDRTYNCKCCGHSQDRDLNAAINIKKQSASYAA